MTEQDAANNPGSGDQECARCGEPFSCGAGTGSCWCKDLPPALAPVAGANCYCPGCLKAIIALLESAR